jgi:hypothetical protein
MRLIQLHESKGGIMMKPMLRGLGTFVVCAAIVLAMLMPLRAGAQSCQTSGELDDATRNSIVAAGQRYYEMAKKGDSASLRQNSIPSLAADFSAVENRVKDHQQDLAQAQAAVQSSFLLDASGSAPIPHAEFLCGVFGKNGQTANSAAFYLDNLPAAKYAVVVLEATSGQTKTTFSVMLQQSGADWKLGNLFIIPATSAGHDSDWYLARAREYKSKGQTHNAWWFYLQARNLVSAMPFMYTLATDKMYDEWHTSEPADMPGDRKTPDLAAGTATYKLTAVFPVTSGNELDLVVRYQSSNASNSTQAYQDNVSVIKAFVAKYPEVKDAFAGVVARAVDSNGQDYGTLLAMKDIK